MYSLSSVVNAAFELSADAAASRTSASFEISRQRSGDSVSLLRLTSHVLNKSSCSIQVSAICHSSSFCTPGEKCEAKFFEALSNSKEKSVPLYTSLDTGRCE